MTKECRLCYDLVTLPPDSSHHPVVALRASHPVGFDLCDATHLLRDCDGPLRDVMRIWSWVPKNNMNDCAWRVRKASLLVAGSSCGESLDRFGACMEMSQWEGAEVTRWIFCAIHRGN